MGKLLEKVDEVSREKLGLEATNLLHLNIYIYIYRYRYKTVI